MEETMSAQTQTQIIHSSAAPLPQLPASSRMDPERLRALRTRAAKTVMERQAAGLAADGRILDMVRYAAHLRNGGQA